MDIDMSIFSPNKQHKHNQKSKKNTTKQQIDSRKIIEAKTKTFLGEEKNPLVEDWLSMMMEAKRHNRR